MLKRIVDELYYLLPDTKQRVSGRNPDISGDCSGPFQTLTDIETLVEKD